MIPICCLCNCVATKPVIFWRNESGPTNGCKSCVEAVETAENELALWIDWFERYPNEKLTINGVD